MNGIQFTEVVRRDHPEIQVILLAPDKMGDTVLNAMRSGASDYLLYDVPLEELKVSIYRAGEIAFAEKQKRSGISAESGKAAVHAEETPAKKGKVITIYSPKGGTGVTTLAINLAIALQGSEEAVGLIDGNIQYGDVSLLLNEIPHFTILDLVTRIYELDTRIVEDVMLLHKSSGIHVLPAPPRPELAEKVGGEHFTIILDFLRQIFNYLIINTSTFITEPCLAALEASDVVVLVTTQEIAAIRNTHAFLSIWDNLGKSKDRLLLVLNRYVKRRNITPERISERMGLPVALTIAEEDDLIFRSLNLGIPFSLSDKESQAAKNIIELSSLLLKEMD
jgi:pilus assembly protein CpaE